TGDLVLTKDALYQLSYIGRSSAPTSAARPHGSSLGVRRGCHNVRPANSSTIATVTSRILQSLRVVKAATNTAPYKTIAIAKRSLCLRSEPGDEFAPTSMLSFWWTGEDSNLRSPKGRQIYSLLVLTAHPPVPPHSGPPPMVELAEVIQPPTGSLQISCSTPEL